MRFPKIPLLLLLSVFLLAKGYAKIDDKTLKKEARTMILEAVATYESDGIHAGIIEVEKKFIEYKQNYRAEYVYVYQVWWEAQKHTGVDDPAWGYHLFRWTLEKLWWKDRTTRDVPANLANIHTKAIEAGFMGVLIELRELNLKAAQQHYMGSFNLELTPEDSLLHRQPRFPNPEDYEMPVIHPKEDRAHTGHEVIKITNLATVEKGLMNWREAYVYAMWLDTWGKTFTPNDLTGLDAMEASEEQYTQTQCKAYVLLGELYQSLGFYERSKQYYRIVSTRGLKAYGSYHSDQAQMYNVFLQSKLGEDITKSIEELRDLRIEILDNKFHENSARHWCDLAIASKLRQQDLNDEAYALLNESLSIAEEETMLLLNIAALEMRIDWAFDDGKLDSIEEDLIAQLQLCRQRGLKASEPDLYVKYARLMALLGNLPEAIELQLVSIDLFKALDLYTWLPVRYFEISELYFKIGNYELADYYSRLAQKLLNTPGSEYPNWMFTETLVNTEQLLAKIDNTLLKPTSEKVRAPSSVDSTNSKSVEPVSPTAHAVLDMQPTEQVCISLAGYPTTGIYTITNFGKTTQEAELVADGAIHSLAMAEDGNISITLDPAAQIEHRSLNFELKPGEQCFVLVEAPEGAVPISAELTLLPFDLSSGISYFSVPSEDGESQAAVINAAMVRENPFYHVSIFHSLRRLPDGDATMNLRFKASQPARIEAYLADGTLLFVDANGDGAFHSAGDILRVDRDLDGFADVDFADESLFELIEITASPHGPIPAEGLEVEVAHKDSQGKWIVDAIDRIE